MRAFISICAWRDVDIQTAYSVMQTLMYSKEPQFAWACHTEDALIDRARCVAATQFLNEPERGDVLVFVDSDISFNPPGIVKLVNDVAEGRDIVGGLYVTRSQRYPRPAVRLYQGQGLRVGPNEPVVEAQYVSTGFFAMSRKCLETMAESLPLVRSGLDYIYPFFLPMIYDNEYLSEDWACAQRALDLGMKVYVDPSISLSHWGRRAYTVDDLNYSALDHTAVFTVLEGEGDKTNIIGDYAGYMGLSRSDAIEKIREVPQAMTRKATAEEWKSGEHSSISQVIDYYKDSEAYLPEIINFDLQPSYWNRMYKPMSVRGRVADFGGGIGTLALMVASKCERVYYIDLPSEHRRFAEFRFQAHRAANIEARASLEGLYGLDYITATDVMEHIHPDMMQQVVESFHTALRPGGRVITINDFGANGEVPQHYDTKELFKTEMVNAGFSGGPEIWVK